MKLSRIRAIMVGIPCCMAVLAGCGDISGKPIELTRTSCEMMEGESATVYALAEEEGKVTWTSSDESVAAVNGGEIVGKKAGTATVTATVGEASAECQVTVTGEEKAATYLQAVENGYYLEMNNTDGVKTQFVLCTKDADGNVTEETPENLQYEMYNKQIASVDENGVIRPLEPGPTTMTVTSGDASCSVEVVVSTKLINNTEDWLTVLNSTNNLSDYYYLTQNLDFSGVNYSGIGTGATAEAENCFRGTIDGGNHSISNVTIGSGGIFGPLLDAKIKNLELKNVTLSSGVGLAPSISGNGTAFENLSIELNYKGGSSGNILAQAVDGCGSMEQCLVTIVSAGSGIKAAGSISEAFTAKNTAVVCGQTTLENAPEGMEAYANRMDAIWAINSTKLFGSDWTYNMNGLPTLNTK